MARLNHYLLLVFLSSMVATCNSAQKSEVEKEPAAEKPNHSMQATSESAEYEGTGTVISVPPGKRNIIIKHGTIPNFMDPMTMPFSVKDSTLLESIEASDSVKFIIKVDSGNIFITSLDKLQ